MFFFFNFAIRTQITYVQVLMFRIFLRGGGGGKKFFFAIQLVKVPS